MLGLRDEAGANAVEFALILPILLILVFGVLTGGALYNQQLTLTQSAREGARFGATLPVSDPDDWKDLVVARVEQVSGGLLDSSNPDHEIEAVPPDATTGELTVFVERPGRLEIIVQAWNLRLSARSVARHETVGAT